jgi:cardiolipin synthase
MPSSKLNKASSSLYTKYNNVKLIRGGKNYFDLLRQVINQARDSIHLQMYIFNDDETGNQIAAALMDAAKRGVKVYMVIDGYASRNLSAEYISNLKNTGINFRWFNPIFRSRYFYFGRRLHHKVVVADAFASLTGGINITNRYNDLEAPAWLDWALYAEGEISTKLYKVCADIWNKSHWRKGSRTKFSLPAISSVPSGECLVRIRVNDWVHSKNQISKSYIAMLKNAEHSIVIMSSYFLPGFLIKKNIVAAAKRSVNIKLIVAGISDVQLAKQAERYMYRWVLKNNIELYEYTKNVLHGKLSVYDGNWATICSYNINNISDYASVELNLDVLDEDFAKTTEVTLKKIIDEDCVRITESVFNTRNNYFMRAWQKMCYGIFRVVVYLFTFYFKKHHG